MLLQGLRLDCLLYTSDVQGSVEAVKQSLVKLSNEEVVVKVIHGGVGAINESDVILDVYKRQAQYGIKEMCADSWRWQKNNPNGYDD